MSRMLNYFVRNFDLAFHGQMHSEESTEISPKMQNSPFQRFMFMDSLKPEIQSLIFTRFSIEFFLNMFVN